MDQWDQVNKLYINFPGESIGLKFIPSQSELFRFIPISVSGPMRIIPNQIENVLYLLEHRQCCQMWRLLGWTCNIKIWQHRTLELKLFPYCTKAKLWRDSLRIYFTFGFEKWLLNEYSTWTFFIATKSFRNNSWKGIQTDQTVWSVN